MAMELSDFVNLIFIFALNVLFFFSGICLNSLVILTFWRSTQLRKKLCYFMIMVLACCDLLVVVTSHPFSTFLAIIWLTEKLDVYASWLDIPARLIHISFGLSLFSLLVMNFDRYLATYYPIFHRTWVTKGKLLTLLAILIIVGLTLVLMSINELIPYAIPVLIFIIILISPILFINYKLFTIARKSRRNNGLSAEMKKSFSLKNISICLLSVACLVVFSIPAVVSIGICAISEDLFTLDNARILGLWGNTVLSMNSTFNCLIFYWKNKILRQEGMKILKGLKLSGSV